MWPMNSMHESNQQISEGKAEIKQKGGHGMIAVMARLFKRTLNSNKGPLTAVLQVYKLI